MKGKQEELFKLVSDSFPEARQQYKENEEEKQNTLVNASYSYPFKDFSFYRTFQFFDDLVDKGIIKDFSLTQSSLE